MREVGMRGLTEVRNGMRDGMRDPGPHTAVELLMPGGSLLMVLRWLYRRYRRVDKDVTQGDARAIDASRLESD
jgi:hypothetical protein